MCEDEDAGKNQAEMQFSGMDKYSIALLCLMVKCVETGSQCVASAQGAAAA